jgi:putative heme iron utilization protein
MDEMALGTLKQLLMGQRVLSLVVQVEDEPVIGMLPFAPARDFSGLIVQASGLARHTQGLRDGAPFEALIHAADTPDTDPLQLPRVTLRGQVGLLDRGGTDYAEDERTYLERLPSASTTLGLGDFRLYRLTIEGGRLVAGFGRAFNLTRETLQRLTA